MSKGAQIDASRLMYSGFLKVTLFLCAGRASLQAEDEQCRRTIYLNFLTISAKAESSGEPPTTASRRLRIFSYSPASSFMGRFRDALTISAILTSLLLLRR